MVNLDLSKQVVLDLTKEVGLDGQKAAIKLVLDFSLSMRGTYQKGTVQRAVERLMPVAMVFDDDQQVEVTIFHDGAYSVPVNVTLKNLEGYVNREIINSRRYNYGGTDYAPAIDLIVQQHKDDNGLKGGEAKKGGFFKSLFGGEEKTKPSGPAKQPTYVMFITDGDTTNKRGVVKSLIEASNYGIHFCCIGLRTSSYSTFEFLKEVDDMSGRLIDNVSFFEFTEQEITSLPDKELYSRLLKEFPQYIKDARKHNLIV